MKAYPEYKDSGVDWIGVIPSHWEMRKVSRSFSLIGSGTTPQSDNPSFYDNGNIPWVMTGDLNDGLLSETSKKITQLAFDTYSALKIYPVGTLLIAMYGATIGKISILGLSGCTNQACCALSTSPYLTEKFVYYWFLANKRQIISYGSGGGQPNISQEIIRELKISTPPPNEQKAIADFLDRKTAQIDRLIEAKQRQIELLQEQRTALINQAVTRGLNPDVEMKDSGVPWLGEIPRHWKVGNLRWISKIYSGGTPSKEKIEYWENGTIPWISSGEVNQEYVTSPSTFITEEGFQNSSAKWIPKGSLVMALAGQGKTKGTVAQLGIDTTCNQSLAAIIPLNINPRYLFFWLKSNYRRIRGLVGDGLRDGLNLEILGSLLTLLPSELEQKEISDYIDQQFAKIDRIFCENQMQIKLLQEYRTALISEAVTGKIDVRTAVEAVHE